MATSDRVYPYTDALGDAWVDPSGLLRLARRRCFICERWTNRFDIDFHGPFCNSYACNLTIELDLKEMTVAEAQAEQALEDGSIHG